MLLHKSTISLFLVGSSFDSEARRNESIIIQEITIILQGDTWK